MKYNLLGKEVRGRFGFPSGVIATNSDTARLMLNHISQLGFYVGKSTTIKPQDGNPEDIFLLPTPDSGWNAVRYANPGLEATIEGFRELIETVPKDVFLMPQIGESDEEGFEHCAAEFDKIEVDGLELNVSCPHAKQGGILIGSDPKMVHSIVSVARKATKKPLVVKLNAGVPNIEEIARVAVDAGANGISAINTLGGPFPELSNKFGGLSGPMIFPVTYDTVQRIRNAVNVPMIVMGGIRSAEDIVKLDKIDPNFFYAIGTALAEMSTVDISVYFFWLNEDLQKGSHYAENTVRTKIAAQYKPFIVKEVRELSQELKLIKFYENMEAAPGQFVFLKVGDSDSKPFSVANDEDGLELVIRKVGGTTSKIFQLKPNNVVRIRGPYGYNSEYFDFLEGENVVFVGAGCGIAPIHHAAKHLKNNSNYFVIGAKTESELVYLDELRKMGKVFCSTDDGSVGLKGTVVDLLRALINQKCIPIPWQKQNAIFFNCGPEVVLKKADEIEREYTTPKRIHHLVERMTSCGTGICGKCSIPGGMRACVDGPVFTAEEFTPGLYKRGKDGRKINI